MEPVPNPFASSVPNPQEVNNSEGKVNNSVAAGTPPANTQNPFAPLAALPNQSQKEGNTAIVLDIKESQKEVEPVSAENSESLFQAVNSWLINLTGVALQEKLLFFQLFGAMIGAGLPIIDSLSLLITQTKNPKMQKVLIDIRQQIESGESLAAAMRYNDDVFDDATCSVVEAGEKSGKLNSVLKELVDQYEKSYSIGKKVKSVLTYPFIVIIAMVLLTVVVLVFVVPKLEELFGGATNLPLPTRILIGGSDFILGYWAYLVAGVVGGGFLFFKWKSSQSGKKIWSLIVLKIPLVGGILQKMILTRVTRILGFLITAGVPVIDSLKISSHIAENPLYQEKILLAADDLTKGISIAENLSDDEKLFPQMLINMIAIGEKTASLDSVMGKAADFYNEELDRKISTLSKSMEPIILGVIALGAVFMILAIYLPILKMNDQVIGSF